MVIKKTTGGFKQKQQVVINKVTGGYKENNRWL